jgi:hypothetical protein
MNLSKEDYQALDEYLTPELMNSIGTGKKGLMVALRHIGFLILINVFGLGLINLTAENDEVGAFVVIILSPIYAVLSIFVIFRWFNKVTGLKGEKAAQNFLRQRFPERFPEQS